MNSEHKESRDSTNIPLSFVIVSSLLTFTSMSCCSTSSLSRFSCMFSLTNAVTSSCNLFISFSSSNLAFKFSCLCEGVSVKEMGALMLLVACTLFAPIVFCSASGTWLPRRCGSWLTEPVTEAAVELADLARSLVRSSWGLKMSLIPSRWHNLHKI